MMKKKNHWRKLRKGRKRKKNKKEKKLGRVLLIKRGERERERESFVDVVVAAVIIAHKYFHNGD